MVLFHGYVFSDSGGFAFGGTLITGPVSLKKPWRDTHGPCPSQVPVSFLSFLNEDDMYLSELPSLLGKS